MALLTAAKARLGVIRVTTAGLAAVTGSVTGVRQRVAAAVKTTPGRLMAMMVTIGLLGLLAGIATVVGAGQRSSQADLLGSRSGPLTVQAQQLYRSLSDADATAAAAFLSSGAEPVALRARYQSDIASASAALTEAGAASDTDKAAVAQIATSLPMYTALVDTARAYNRLNLPVGAAYLREASGLMRQSLLPAAARLYQQETDRLAADRGGASGVPWLAIPLVLLTLAALGATQLHLFRLTHRQVNVGLGVATGAGLVLLLWLTASWIGAAVNVSASHRDGSAQVELVAQARIAALTARADESLTLVARGSGGAFEDDFTAAMDRLAGKDGSGGLLAQAMTKATDPAVREALAAAKGDVIKWSAVHRQLRGLDDGGQYPDAVQLAIGAAPTSAASVFNRVDADLATAIATASTAFDRRAGSASNAMTGTGAGLPMLTVILLAGLIVGLQQRIAEYR